MWERLTAHFLEFALVDLFAHPRLALDLLSVHLPFGEEANLKSR
jgi:hypothetical protein